VVTGVEVINIYNTLTTQDIFGGLAVDASKFVGSQQIWQIDGANSITKLGGAQTAGFRGDDVDGFVVTASGAVANIAFDGAKPISGTIDFSVAGTALSTVNIAGTFASAATKAGTTITSGTNVTTLSINSSLAAKSALTLVDGFEADGGNKVTTLNLNISKDATVDATDLRNLTVVNAAASTGGITLDLYTDGRSVNSITTGSGDDVVTLNTVFTGTVVSASVSTGAGDDDITVITDELRTGKITVDAGTGDDFINLVGATITAEDSINGGTGNDVVMIAGSAAARVAENLVILRNKITNVETLAFAGTEGALDASTLKNVFAKLAFVDVGDAADSVVTNVTVEDIIVIDGANINVSAKDYVATKSFGGDLNVVVTTDDYAASGNVSAPYIVKSKVTAKGEDLTLSVVANSSSENGRGEGEETNSGTPISALLAVELEGDIKTATVNLSSSVNSKSGVANAINAALVDINTEATGGQLTSLTTVNLSGNGIAFIQNENNSKLASVSALGLNSTIGSYYEFNEYDAAVLFGSNQQESYFAHQVYGGDYISGDKSFGLIYNTSNAAVAETITLGNSIDIIKFDGGSTFAKMDKVIGLNLELNAAGSALSNQSDAIFVVGSGFVTNNGTADFAKLSSLEISSIAQKAGNNLDLYLTEVAKLAQDQVVFQLNGNTYVFVDGGDTAVLENADQVIELVGSINLDALLVSLNNPAGSMFAV
jgi:hypothetical protein